MTRKTESGETQTDFIAFYFSYPLNNAPGKTSIRFKIGFKVLPLVTSC